MADTVAPSAGDDIEMTRTSPKDVPVAPTKIVVLCETYDCTIRVREQVEDEHGSASQKVIQITDFLVDRAQVASSCVFLKTKLTSQDYGDTGGLVVPFEDIPADIMNVILCIAHGLLNAKYNSDTKHSNFHHFFRTLKPGQLVAVQKVLALCADDGFNPFEIYVRANEMLIDNAGISRWFQPMHAFDPRIIKYEAPACLAVSYHLGLSKRFLDVSREIMLKTREPITRIAPEGFEFYELPHSIIEHMEKLRVTNFTDPTAILNAATAGGTFPDVEDPGLLEFIRQCLGMDVTDTQIGSIAQVERDSWMLRFESEGTFYLEAEDKETLARWEQLARKLDGVCLKCCIQSLVHPWNSGEWFEGWREVVGVEEHCGFDHDGFTIYASFLGTDESRALVYDEVMYEF